MNPDYTKYTLVELYDVKDNIDKECYPKRYDLLLNEIRKRENEKKILRMNLNLGNLLIKKIKLTLKFF